MSHFTSGQLNQLGDIVLAIEVGRTELWLHEKQKTSWVQGRKILTHLKDTGLLAGFADLPELQAIQGRGIEFFRKHGFAGKAIVGWRGVQDGSVPYLIANADGVVLRWRHLGHYFSAGNPGLRRK